MKNKKTLWLAVGLAVTALLTGTACSLSPVFFSEKQVFAYVRLVYGTGYILTGIDRDGEEDGDRYYTFENRDGFSFTVTAYTYHPHFDASETSFYSPGISSDYKEQVYRLHREELKTLNEKQVFEIVECSADRIRLSEDSREELEAAARYIVEADAILEYRFTPDVAPAGMSGWEEYPADVDVYWDEVYLENVLFSSDGEGLDEREVLRELEEAREEAAENGKIGGEPDGGISGQDGVTLSARP